MMDALLLAAGSVLLLILWLPTLSELLCLLRGRRLPPPGPVPPDESLPRLLFLVPAHNEELLISECVRSLLGQGYPADRRRVVVVADNCEDRTAALTRAEGAECLERRDLDAPGKPQALAWALGQLPFATTADAVIIIDADTVVAPDFAREIARTPGLRDTVMQANFLVSNEDETWLTRLGGLLSRCRYDISYPLKESAGINCPLTGNGMCFGSEVLARVGWQAFSITEDSELYVQHTIAGVRIHHARGANLYSQEAASMSQGATQRRRWLAGRIWILQTYGGALLRSRAIGWHQKLDVVVELVLSSPVLHTAAALGVALGLWLADPYGQGRLLALLAAGSLIGLVLTTGTAFLRHPRRGRLLLDALRLPGYLLWRIVLVGKTLLTLRERHWTRTARHTAPRD